MIAKVFQRLLIQTRFMKGTHWGFKIKDKLQLAVKAKAHMEPLMILDTANQAVKLLENTPTILIKCKVQLQAKDSETVLLEMKILFRHQWIV